jgi:hypothetical protein
MANHRPRKFNLYFLAAIQGAAVLGILLAPGSIGERTVFLLALPFGQASLLVLWALRGAMPFYVRTPLAILGLVGVWLLTLRLLPQVRIHEPQGAAWASLYVTQAVMLAAVVSAARLALAWRADARAEPLPQYGVGYLLLLVTSLCGILAGLRWGMQFAGWSHAVTRWQYFFFLPVIGTYNAATALIAVALLGGRGRWPVRGGLVLASSIALGITGPWLLRRLFGETGGIDAWQFCQLTGGQGLYLVLSLLPLGRRGRPRAVVTVHGLEEEKCRNPQG